jgi:hypothetical protein
MAPRKRPHIALTAKDLGLVPETKLSASYANSRAQYKIIEDMILGYWVVGDNRLAPVKIAPIYRAQVHLRPKTGPAQMISSCEVGKPYNFSADPSDPDGDGDAFAYQAMIAIGALQRHAERREMEAKAKKRRK